MLQFCGDPLPIVVLTKSVCVSVCLSTCLRANSTQPGLADDILQGNVFRIMQLLLLFPIDKP